MLLVEIRVGQGGNCLAHSPGLGSPPLQRSVHSDELEFKRRYLAALREIDARINFITARVNSSMQCSPSLAQFYASCLCRFV